MARSGSRQRRCCAGRRDGGARAFHPARSGLDRRASAPGWGRVAGRVRGSNRWRRARLDAGTPLGGLVLQAAAAVAGTDEAPTSAAGRRALWREVGIDCDALSSDVLVLGVRPRDGWIAEQLRRSADAGEPRRLTLREVKRAVLRVDPGTTVHVCENPSVVEAAADALGGRCAALVCAEGVPSTAALELLRGLAAGGARLLAHADFDWAGLRIVGQLAAVVGASPWRMGVTDYRAGSAASPSGPILGAVGAASAGWDAELVAAMRENGRAVLEEHVLTALLDELSS